MHSAHLRLIISSKLVCFTFVQQTVQRYHHFECFNLTAWAKLAFEIEVGAYSEIGNFCINGVVRITNFSIKNV